MAGFSFDNSFATELGGAYAPCKPEGFAGAKVVVQNESLAAELGIALDELGDSAAGVFSGSVIPEGATPVALAYAGHQFGGFVPQLGDGRAVLLGEVIDVHGRRRDIQLKGSGATPFSRGGDGRATLGPVLREYLMGEAMHRLGVPTTRALAAVTTGEQVIREGPLPGALLVRVARSHLRVGTFQFFSARGDRDMLARLVEYALRRHYPDGAGGGAVGLLGEVARSQAELIASWMLVGFVHGVMNTDNTTISGETIDYGPCAFMDAYDPATVFSSIDRRGRYAYGNQPAIGAWNLARLAEALLPVIDADEERAVQLAQPALERYREHYEHSWLAGMRKKIGLDTCRDDDVELVEGLLKLMQQSSIDYTRGFRSLAGVLAGEGDAAAPELPGARGFADWRSRWTSRLADEARPPSLVAAQMNRVNPLYIPRNHVVEAALEAAIMGEIGPFERLLAVLGRPFEEQPVTGYADPAPSSFGPYRTFCGT